MPILAAMAACTVIAVTDGDTLKVRCESAGPDVINVRIEQIDAPERGQAFGRIAKKRLSWLCLNQPASLEVSGLDRYQRTIARVQCRGRDAGQDMLKAGMAWVYPSQAKNANLMAIQDEAKTSRRGLWRDSNPEAPWEYRKNSK